MNLFTTSILVVTLIFATANAVPTKRSKLIELLFFNYDKTVRPNYGDGPVNIALTAYVSSNVVVEETKTSISLETTMYFRRSWNDSRLQFIGDKSLFGGKELRDKVWTPDLFFANSYEVKTFDDPEPNVFLRITPDGSVLLSERIQVKWRCAQSWLKFPCDILTCSLELESYGYSTEDIQIKKKIDSFGIADSVMDNFVIENATFVENLVSLSTGNYDRIKMEFKLKRNITDVKFTMATDKRYPDFYSSIPLKQQFDVCP